MKRFSTSGKKPCGRIEYCSEELAKIGKAPRDWRPSLSKGCIAIGKASCRDRLLTGRAPPKTGRRPVIGMHLDE